MRELPAVEGGGVDDPDVAGALLGADGGGEATPVAGPGERRDDAAGEAVDGAGRGVRRIEHGELRVAVDVGDVGDAACRRAGQHLDVPVGRVEGRDGAGGGVHRGKGEELPVLVGQQVDRRSVRRPLRRGVGRIAGPTRELGGLSGSYVEQEELVVEAGGGLAHEEIAAVGRPGDDAVAPVLLPHQSRFVGTDVAHVDVEERPVTPVRHVGDGPAVGRPRAEGVDDLGVAGQGRDLRRVVGEEVELAALIAALVHAEEDVASGGGVPGVDDALGVVSELLRCAARGGDAPELREAGDVGEEGHALAVGGEGGGEGAADVEELLERVGARGLLPPPGRRCVTSGRRCQYTRDGTRVHAWRLRRVLDRRL